MVWGGWEHNGWFEVEKMLCMMVEGPCRDCVTLDFYFRWYKHKPMEKGGSQGEFGG